LEGGNFPFDPHQWRNGEALCGPLGHSPVHFGGDLISTMSQEKIKEIYEFFFKTADADGDGFVSGGEAAGLFRKSGLTDDVLKSVRYP
jgi:hypothetical protein